MKLLDYYQKVVVLKGTHAVKTAIGNRHITFKEDRIYYKLESGEWLLSSLDEFHIYSRLNQDMLNQFTWKPL